MNRHHPHVLLLLLATVNACATTYYVRPDGHDDNPGTTNSPAGAWSSIDRGQPTWLREPCKAGDTTLHVVKTSHFPDHGKLQIGDATFTYSGKTLQSFTGCRGTPEAKAGALISCPERLAAGPGDTVIVKQGVYTLHYEEPPHILPNVGLGVVMISQGGTKDAPLVIRGEGLPVVDAQSESKVRSFLVRSDHVHVEGFDLRRGGFWSGWTRGGKLLNCRVHEGSHSVSFAYSRDLEIAFNRIYDFQGAWTTHGIVLNQCAGSSLHHNTIVSNERGITINGGRNLDIGHNLIAWCGSGILFGNDRQPENCRLHNNNLWWIRSGIWLQRDDNKGDENYYVNTQPGATDISEDPMIVEWTPDHPGFLDYHPDSPCLRDGKPWIGAGAAAAGYPDAGNVPGRNLVFNPSFEAGLTGWALSSWNSFLPEQAGWEIVDDPGAEGERCLAIYDFPQLKGRGERIDVRARSQHFRYTRGRPLILSFRARAETEGARLGVGFTVPSWQNKSGVGATVKLTTEWQTYRHTQAFPPRFPDYAAASFTTHDGRYWIDAVKVEEGTNSTPFSPMLEFVPDRQPGMLLMPGSPLKGQVINRTTQPVTGLIKGSLNVPLRGTVAQIDSPFSIDAGARAPISITLPRNLTGIFLFDYGFEVAGKTADPAQLRFSIGVTPPKGRNHDFFAATPPWEMMPTGALLDRQMESLTSLGLGTLHLYMGYPRINNMLANKSTWDRIDAARKAGLEWLFTPSDAKALTGEATWAPGPGRVGPDAIEFHRPKLAKGRCTPAQFEAWDGAVGMLVEAMKGRVKYYEVLNEPNTFLDGSEYTNVLTRTARVIRAVDPAARVLGGSVVNATRGDLWNKTMALPAGTFDAFSYHPYCFGLRNPERDNMSYRADLLRAKEDLAKHGHPTAVWLTEEGMGPGLDETRCIGQRLGHSAMVRKQDWGEGEILQAQYASRMYATALGEGAAGYSYHTLNGLVRDALMSPMLALKAIHTMALVLGDADPLGQIDVGYDHICYLFNVDPHHIVAAVWAKDAEYAKPIQIKLPDTGKLQGVDLFGFSSDIHTHNKTSTLMLGRELVYLTFHDRDFTSVEKTLKRAFGGVHSRPGRIFNCYNEN